MVDLNLKEKCLVKLRILKNVFVSFFFFFFLLNYFLFNNLIIEFKGEPDPLRGDELNRRVREMARECLDAVFDSQMPVTTSAVAAANRIQGMGNNYQPEPVVKTTSSSFLGNIVSNITNMMGESEPSYVAHPGAGGAIGGPSQLSTHQNVSATGMVGIGSNPQSGSSSGWLNSISSSFSSTSTTSSSFVPSNTASSTGFSFVSNRGVESSTSNFGVQTVPSLPPASSFTGKVGAAASDGEYEKGIISSLCEPGGLKPVPQESKLNDFLGSASTLSPSIIGSCLLEELQSESWQSKAKALLVITSLVQHTGCEAHLNWWKNNTEEVYNLTQSSKSGVRGPAAKAYKSITGQDAGGSTNFATSTTPSGSGSLLDFDAPSPSFAPPPVPPSAPVTTSSPSNLFDGLSVGSTPSLSPVQNSSNFFQTTTSAPAPVSGFDFISSSPASVAPTTPVASTSPAALIDNLDIFSNLSISSPSTVTPSTNLLDDFNPVSSPSVPVTSTAPSSSGFSFLSASTSPAADISSPSVMNNSSSNASSISSAFDFDFTTPATTSAPATTTTSSNSLDFLTPSSPTPAPLTTTSPTLSYPTSQPTYPTQPTYPQNQPVYPPQVPGQYGQPIYPPQGQFYPPQAPYGQQPFYQQQHSQPPQPFYPPGPQGHGQFPMGQPQYISPSAAPAMSNPILSRKNIPDTTNFQTQQQQQPDSFSFVADTLKQMK